MSSTPSRLPVIDPPAKGRERAKGPIALPFASGGEAQTAGDGDTSDTAAKGEEEAEGPADTAPAPPPPRPARRRPRWRHLRPPRPTIAQRVFLVGAIPILSIAAIGALAIVLLDRADLGRAGALDAATIYRQVVSGMSAQDGFVGAEASGRERYAAAFTASVSSAAAGLSRLAERTGDPAQAAAVTGTLSTLDRYRALMADLTVATQRTDALAASMDRRLQTLILLTDEARQRQKRANLDLVASLEARDGQLKRLRDVVETAQALRSALADGLMAGGAVPAPDPFEAARIRNGHDQLAEALNRSRNAGAAASDRPGLPELAEGDGPGGRALLGWLDRELKIDAAAQRSLQSEIADLLAYTISAHETEQATQTIAIDTLKLGRASTRIIAGRSPPQVAGLLAVSRAIGDNVASLPISPLIQTEMIDAMQRWQEDLGAMKEGLATQNGLLVAMSDTAGIMLLQVSDLNNELSAQADEIGTAVRRIGLFGGGLAFLLASAGGLLVARSITGPLRRLETGMMDRASSGRSSPLPDAGRRDEIGSMARATNRFLAEIGHREAALRLAVEEADDALRRLRDTQSELIQAEKLASLGQLVAGVAHEINTPLGVALTTATTVTGEVMRFEAETREGRITKAAFDDFVARLGEGTRLTTRNVERAAHLVQAFKQVAADQTSGERRCFSLGDFAQDLFISLGPMGRRGGHRLEVVCEKGLELDSYPGALAQVLTNLLSNAYAHAFRERTGGAVTVTIARSGPGGVRIRFSDDGRGIAAADRARIFDPFFTTGRATGSTGLGLHIVFNLVTATLGGSIAVGSEVGRGTTFTLDLPIEAPRHDPAATLTDEAPAEPAPAAAGRTQTGEPR
ncbi:HAMP domain-containing sensor histidine kinase [Aureimonas sp. AU12]|uniref:sensor histidine kinase n=1 Tax=Aureimonas sp. AU12 TaxID=1638161 RepID=UPI0007839B8D|nr:HAMP domain-containing sensor histidine kinase [Aureimonas sp. AU12]